MSIVPEYNIAKRIIYKFVHEKDEFLESELHKAILDAGGLMRVGMCYTVREFLEENFTPGFVTFSVLPHKFREEPDRLYKINRDILKDIKPKLIDL